jgi:hypothetical protein
VRSRWSRNLYGLGIITGRMLGGWAACQSGCWMMLWKSAGKGNAKPRKVLCWCTMPSCPRIANEMCATGRFGVRPKMDELAQQERMAAQRESLRQKLSRNRSLLVRFVSCSPQPRRHCSRRRWCLLAFVLARAGLCGVAGLLLGVYDFFVHDAARWYVFSVA